jgi:FKBP-type peptidyl-prolyl cis-trans isomerase SlyD
MLIGQNCVVSIDYELTNDAGELLDASPAGEPLTYLHGASNIITGLEHELTGKTVGAQFAVTIQPEDGYGPRLPHLIQEVPRDAFPDPDAVTPGMRFSAQSDDGTLSVVVTDISGDAVTVDANHPLAGEVLHFSVNVTAVRDATREEISHGHPH